MLHRFQLEDKVRSYIREGNISESQYQELKKYLEYIRKNPIKRGDTIVVIRGRKIKKGTVGEIFWIKDMPKYNPGLIPCFSSGTEKRIGMHVKGSSEPQWTALDNVAKLVLVEELQLAEVIQETTGLRILP